MDGKAQRSSIPVCDGLGDPPALALEAWTPPKIHPSTGFGAKPWPELGAGMPRLHRSAAATRQIDVQAELPPSKYWLIEPLRWGTIRWAGGFVNCAE